MARLNVVQGPGVVGEQSMDGCRGCIGEKVDRVAFHVTKVTGPLHHEAVLTGLRALMESLHARRISRHNSLAKHRHGIGGSVVKAAGRKALERGYRYAPDSRRR